MADLQGTFEYLGLNGALLSAAEQTALQCSLLRLSRESGSHVKFWGKVTTVGKTDYLIAQSARVLGGGACDLGALGERASWYSVDGGNRWTPLAATGPKYTTPKGEKRPGWMDDDAALRKESNARCEAIRGHFWGDPDFEYKVREQMPEPEPEAPPPPPPKPEGEEGEEKEEGEAEDEDEEEKKEGEEGDEPPADAEAAEGEEGGDAAAAPKKKKPKYMLVATRESTRLAHFVEQHDTHCQVVPHGMLMLTGADAAAPPTVAANRTWHGLRPGEAGRLQSYLHLRPCISGHPLPSKSESHYNPVLDFMESIGSDVPAGVWSIQYDPALGVAVGRNLLYQGSVFYHRPSSACFGQYYFGDGRRNLDLCFMLPEGDRRL